MTDRSPDPLLVEVVQRLSTIKIALGPRVFRDAAHRALAGMGAAVHAEAVRRSGSRALPNLAASPTSAPYPALIGRAEPTDEGGER